MVCGIKSLVLAKILVLTYKTRHRSRTRILRYYYM